jgi:hypothetical protein
MATQVLLKNVTLAFPALGEPQAYGEGEPAYGAKFPIEPNSENAKLIEDAIKAEAKETWKDKADSVLAMLVEDGKVAYSRREYRSKKTGEPYAGFEKTFYLGTRNTTVQPSVYDQYGDEVVGKAEITRKAFSGAVVNASIEVWAQDNKWGRRINCSLRGIMLTGEGQSFGGGSGAASADDFASLVKAKADVDDVL